MHAAEAQAAERHTPPPFAQATVNDQKLTDLTPSVAWTRALLAWVIHMWTVLRGFEAEMVAHKRRLDISNKTLMSSDHWGPKTGTCSLTTLTITGPQAQK